MQERPPNNGGLNFTHRYHIRMDRLDDYPRILPKLEPRKTGEGDDEFSERVRQAYSEMRDITDEDIRNATAMRVASMERRGGLFRETDLTADKVIEFLNRLTSLSKEYGVEIVGCGCCGSPAIVPIGRHDAPGYMCDDGGGYMGWK